MFACSVLLFFFFFFSFWLQGRRKALPCFLLSERHPTEPSPFFVFPPCLSPSFALDAATGFLFSFRDSWNFSFFLPQRFSRRQAKRILLFFPPGKGKKEVFSSFPFFLQVGGKGHSPFPLECIPFFPFFSAGGRWKGFPSGG